MMTETASTGRMTPSFRKRGGRIGSAARVWERAKSVPAMSATAASPRVEGAVQGIVLPPRESSIRKAMVPTERNSTPQRSMRDRCDSVGSLRSARSAISSASSPKGMLIQKIQGQP